MSGEKESASADQAPQKYSRYRARKPEPEKQNQPEIENKEKQHSDISRTKSMSRYRKRSAVTNPNQTPITSLPVPEIPRTNAQSPIGDGFNGSVRDSTRSGGENMQQRQQQRSLADGTRYSVRAAEPEQSSQRQLEPRPPVDMSRHSQVRPHETEDERLRRKVREFQEREMAQRKAIQEQEEQARRTQQQKEEAEAELARLAEGENARKLVEQKRKDLERLQVELDAAKPGSGLPAVSSPEREKLGFFSRKKYSTQVTPPTTSGGSGSALLAKSRGNEPQKGIEQGGGGIVPRTDAPISASNAGERRVLVRCKQSSINLPITPETTPVDIIYSAANIMTQNIIPSTAILLEAYTHLGLERRVRRYEHIRDIMNSWDRDTQNALILHNSDTPKFDLDLEASSVGKEAPGDVTVFIYHSQKPGKWNKRYVTLLSNGQMFISKKSSAKISDRDSVSICHLSDFDIYTPTPQQIRKVLKPPKKHCYAVKSQQKTTMFLNTENFVHFFNTDDEPLAEKFYAAIQRWRSWYLVNRMGEGKKKSQSSKTKTIDSTSSAQNQFQSQTLKPVAEIDTPYTIGTFAPLMSLDRFNSPSDAYDSEEESRPRQIPFHLRNSFSAAPQPPRKESKRHPPPVAYKLPPEAEEEFASSGLLGRSYSQRQKLQKDREREREAKKVAGAIFKENSLLAAGPGEQRMPSMNSTSPTGQRPDTSSGSGSGGGLGRSKPKPLLDFTPTFKEAPQWEKTGKGRGVDAPAGVPLIEVANSPVRGTFGDTIPRDTVFRREDAGGGRAIGLRPTSSGEGLLRSRSGGERPKTSDGRGGKDQDWSYSDML